MNNCAVLDDDDIDNNNNDTDDVLRETDLIEYSAIRRLLATLHIAAIVTSAVGNGLLLVYILHHRRRTRSTASATATTLILNLASVDFVSSAVSQPMRLFDMLTPNLPGFDDSAAAFCRTSGFVALFLACVGFHTIVAIGQERLLLICYPLTAKAWLTRRTTVRILLSIWIVAFCSALPFPVLFSCRVNIPLPTYTYNFCTIGLQHNNGRYYYIFIFTVYYALPVVVVIASYARVFASLTETAAYGGCLKDEAVTKLIRHRRSLAWMMAAVAASFAAFEGPFFCTFLYLSLGFKFRRNRVFVKMLIDFLPILSHAVNPAVYLMRAKTFRRSIAVSGSETRISRVTTRTANGRLDQTMPMTSGGRGTQHHGCRCREISPNNRNQVSNATILGGNSHTIRR